MARSEDRCVGACESHSGGGRGDDDTRDEDEIIDVFLTSVAHAPYSEFTFSDDDDDFDFDNTGEDDESSLLSTFTSFSVASHGSVDRAAEADEAAGPGGTTCLDVESHKVA